MPFLFPIMFAMSGSIVAIFILLLLIKTRAEAAKYRRECNRLKLTLELAEDIGRFGYWQFVTGSEFVFWSDYVFDLHQRPRVSGYPTLEQAINYYHPDDRQMVDDAVSNAIVEGDDFEFSAQIITENGNETPVRARGTCQFDQEGNVLSIFGCFVDMSERKDRVNSSLVQVQQ